MFRSRLLVAVFAVLYFATLVGFAFVVTPGSNGQFWVWTTLAFIPVGAFLVCIFGRQLWGAAIIFSLVAAIWLEAAQTVWMPVGYADIFDILVAGVGAAVGVAGGVGMLWWREYSRRSENPSSTQLARNLASNRRASGDNPPAPFNLDQ
jgi:hypothetical protein